MEDYNLTNAQKRIIYTEEIYCEPRISNEGGFYKISTPFNLYKLLDAVVSVLNSSKVFRTTFLLKNEEIVQKYRDFKFDNSIVNIFFDKKEFENYKRVCLDYKFDIYNDFLFKLGIYQNENGGQLFVMFHHSIVDAYSIGLIAGAIFDIYNGHEFNIGTEYIEYLQEEQRYFEDTEKFNEDKIYWKNRLYSCKNSFANIPENPSSEKILIRLDDNYLEKWELFLKKNHLNENIFLITLLCIYKYRIANEKNGILGVPYYNRRNKRFYNSFGMFTSTVPFSYSLSGEESIIDAYKEIKRNFLKDIKHSGYPYNELINNLKANGKNLFEWSFNYYVDNMNYLVEGSKVVVKEETPNYLPVPISIIYRRFKYQKNELELIYNKKIYTREQINSLIKNFFNFTTNITHCETVERISKIQIAKPEFISKIIERESKSLKKIDKNADLSLMDRVMEISKKFPNNIALRLGHSTVTYEALFKLIKNRVTYLKTVIKTGDKIGVIGYKEFDTFINILSLVQMGITYVPIDPEYPQKRQKFILEDSNCSYYVDHNKLKINPNYKSNSTSSDHSTLYILYTSGTTGTPKGVRIPETGIIRLINDNNLKELSDGYDTFLQLNSLGFDISELEIWLPLTSGKTLEIIPKNYIFDIEKLSQILTSNHKFGSIMSFTLLQELFSYNNELFNHFKFIITGGEIVKNKLIENIYHSNENIIVVNGYGPTENSVLSTIQIIDRNNKESIPIGKSISGSSTYILDQFGNVCAPMQIGEIIVGGQGVANGYINREELNKKNFFYLNSLNGEKLYRSGDFGYYNYKSELIIIGRKDSQVKINGQRIEISEIEEVIQDILNSKSIQIVVSVIDNTVVCFYTGSKIDDSRLRKTISEVLTSVMVPKYFINISEIPLTVNGKLNNKILAEKFKKEVSNISINNVKVNLDNIDLDVQEELKNLLIKEINFSQSFIENGGDSLSAMKLVNYMKKKNKNIRVSELLSMKPLIEVFNNSYKSEDDLQISKDNNLSSVKASAVQQSIFFDEKFHHIKYKYNSPLVFELNGVTQINENKILDKISKFISSQRMLHSCLRLENGEIIFKVNDHEIDIVRREISSGSLNDSIKCSLTDFDVEKNLFCCNYISLKNTKFLIFDFHHAIFDGGSREIFTQNLKDYLSGIKKESSEIDYFDYLNSIDEKNNIEDEEFWKKEIKSLGNLSNDMVQNYDAEISNYYPINISSKIIAELLKVSKATSVTISTLLLSALFLTKNKISYKSINTIGITISTRSNEVTSKIIGPFFNTLPLSISENNISNDSKFFNKIGEMVNELVNHCQYPFNKIDSMYKAYCGEYANNLMDWMYVFNHDKKLEFENEGIKFKSIDILDTVQAKYSLSLLVNIKDNNNFSIGFESKSQFYNGKKIQDIILEFERSLDEILTFLEYKGENNGI